MLLEKMKENYLNYVLKNLEFGTWKFYDSHLNYSINWFFEQGIVDSDDIDLNFLSKFILQQNSRGVSNSTINKRILALKNMFKYNKIANVVLSQKNLKQTYKTFNALTNVEFKKVLDYVDSSRMKLQNKLIIHLFVDTGIRLNELMNIKVKNINFSNNTIFLEKTKNHVCRFVPFTGSTAVLLKQYLENFSSIFLITVKYKAVESLVDRIEKVMNFKLHPHMFRHTLSSKLHVKGLSLMMIQKIMGHTNLSTTQRYIHFDLDDMLKSYNSVM